MEYDRTDIPATYVKARQLPEATLRIWLDAIADLIVGPVRRIVDVGCGTGRFSDALAERFNARLIGIDPSFRMLSQARSDGNNVRFIRGDTHAVPIRDDSSDLVFLSMVFHHLTEPIEATREWFRVLRAGGKLCIRNSTLDLHDRVPYLKYFPSARRVGKKMLPGKSELIGTIQANGFSLVDHTVINQVFAGSFNEYREKLAQRALSDLASITDSEFEEGLEAMARDEDSQPDGPILEPVDLFVFKIP